MSYRVRTPKDDVEHPCWVVENNRISLWVWPVGGRGVPAAGWDNEADGQFAHGHTMAEAMLAAFSRCPDRAAVEMMVATVFEHDCRLDETLALVLAARTVA